MVRNRNTSRRYARSQGSQHVVLGVTLQSGSWRARSGLEGRCCPEGFTTSLAGSSKPASIDRHPSSLEALFVPLCGVEALT